MALYSHIVDDLPFSVIDGECMSFVCAPSPKLFVLFSIDFCFLMFVYSLDPLLINTPSVPVPYFQGVAV